MMADLTALNRSSSLDFLFFFRRARSSSDPPTAVCQRGKKTKQKRTHKQNTEVALSSIRGLQPKARGQQQHSIIRSILCIASHTREWLRTNHARVTSDSRTSHNVGAKTLVETSNNVCSKPCIIRGRQPLDSVRRMVCYIAYDVSTGIVLRPHTYRGENNRRKQLTVTYSYSIGHRSRQAAWAQAAGLVRERTAHSASKPP